MSRPGAVAFAASDSEFEFLRIARSPFRFRQRKSIRVAFKATRWDETAEVHFSIQISRTVNPLVDTDQIGNRQLVKKSLLPEEISLPFSS